MKRISQRDIAKKLGVNVSTVSRALNGLKGVSETLKHEIEELAKEQGYHPNPFAASLRYDTTQTIGIVVPDVSFNHFAHIIKRIDADSARQATHYLIDGGARRIAFLGGSQKMKQTAERKHGYLEALRERNILIGKLLYLCSVK